MKIYPGTRYDEKRQWLLPQGVVARNLAEHQLFPRPKRDSRAAAFDELSGNTTLGAHLSQIAPGGSKRGHRHVDEATFYIVSGRGWSELKQGDDRKVQRVEWQTGNIIAIPANAWHQHFNADPDQPVLQLALKNTRLLRTLFASRDFVYANDFRFHDRYDDEDDYWTRRWEDESGVIHTSMIADPLAEPLPEAPDAGRFVARRDYRLGGHRMLGATLVEVQPGGYVRPHRHLAEEAILVLTGRGRTVLWDGAGREATFGWGPGDLLCPPFNTWHQHLVEGKAQVRYLTVRNMFIHRALGLDETALETRLPDRFPTLIEPSYADEPADPLAESAS